MGNKVLGSVPKILPQNFGKVLCLPEFCSGILGIKPVKGKSILPSLLGRDSQKQREKGDIGHFFLLFLTHERKKQKTVPWKEIAGWSSVVIGQSRGERGSHTQIYNIFIYDNPCLLINKIQMVSWNLTNQIIIPS